MLLHCNIFGSVSEDVHEHANDVWIAVALTCLVKEYIDDV